MNQCIRTASKTESLYIEGGGISKINTMTDNRAKIKLSLLDSAYALGARCNLLLVSALLKRTDGTAILTKNSITLLDKNN